MHLSSLHFVVVCSLFLPSLVAAVAFQITQTTIVSPTSDSVALGGSMVVTTYVLSNTTRSDISVSATILASNGANTAFSQNGFTIDANVNKLFTFNITVPTSFSTGTASVYITIHENNPWTLLATGSSVGFTIVAASASTTPSASKGSSPSESPTRSLSTSPLISPSPTSSTSRAASTSNSPSAIATTYQVLQTTIVSPTGAVSLGGNMVVTATIVSPVTRSDLSVSAIITTSNGANTAFSQTGFTVQANVQKGFTFNITVPTNEGFNTGASTVNVNIYENSPWTLLATGPDVPFTLQAAGSTASPSPSPSTSRVVSASASSSTVRGSSPSVSVSTSHAISQSPSPSASNGPALLFSDDFNTLSIASTSNPSGNWMPDDFAWQSKTSGYKDFAGTNWNLNPNDPTTDYLSAFSVSSGILTISSIRTPSSINAAIQAELTAQGVSGSVPAWCGGIMISQYAYTGGYLEYRAQWPNSGLGMFPALWMYATDPGPASKGQAEIDLLEMFGAADAFPTTVYTRSSNGTGPSQQYGPYSLNTTEWHTYGIDRQPSWIRVYVDRELIYSFTTQQVEWFNGVSMSIRLNYAMDAPWFSTYGLESDSATPSPLLMNVDYVKVWASFP